MTNPLDGKPLRYLIGGNDIYSHADEVIELSYDARKPSNLGIGVKYCNLFLEKYGEMSDDERAAYAPYLPDDDISEQYNEGRIDPSGPGWYKNIDEQCQRALKQGFEILEWDNPDSYGVDVVLDVLNRVQGRFKVLAKNPGICAGSKSDYIGHPAVIGIVVERNCGMPSYMEALRVAAGKPTLPVWFVAFGDGRAWANQMAEEITHELLYNMSVTYSSVGEYGNSQDILLPTSPPVQASEEAVVNITIRTTGNVTMKVTKQED